MCLKSEKSTQETERERNKESTENYCGKVNVTKIYIYIERGKKEKKEEVILLRVQSESCVSCVCVWSLFFILLSGVSSSTCTGTSLVSICIFLLSSRAIV